MNETLLEFMGVSGLEPSLPPRNIYAAVAYSVRLPAVAHRPFPMDPSQKHQKKPQGKAKQETLAHHCPEERSQ